MKNNNKIIIVCVHSGQMYKSKDCTICKKAAAAKNAKTKAAKAAKEGGGQ